MEYRLRPKHMGLGLVMLSGIFLFNPVVAFLDVLPDLLGYLLLCAGLFRLADINSHLSDAAKHFRTLLFVGVGELFCTYLVYGVMRERAAEMNPYERPVSILLFSFVVLVLQCCFLIPAFRELFVGLDQLASYHGSKVLCEERKGKTGAERMIRLSTVFVILRSTFAVLPELTILTSFEHDAKNELFPFDWYAFIDLFRVAGGLLGAVIALIWLVSFLKYFGKVLGDREWIKQLEDRYVDSILPQTEMLVLRRFRISFLILNIAVLFTVNLRVDERAALPGVVAAILTVLSLWLIKDRLPDRKPIHAACLLLGGVSLFQIIVNTFFLSRFLPEASLYQADAYHYFWIVRLVDTAEVLATALFVGVLLKLLFSLVLSETAVEYEGGVDAARLSEHATQRLHKEFANRFTVILILFLSSSAVNVLDALLRLQYPWLWLISFALSAAAIWLFYSMIYELFSEIQNQYQSKTTYKRE